MSKLKLEKYIIRRKKPVITETTSIVSKKIPLNEEIIAVIGLALNMHLQDFHDYEKTVLTMQKVMRPYSPWSSKIYGLRQIPFKIPRTNR
ncbi:MAG: hypothetical protein HGB12_01280 [Bacteroidetes bacterium]|nr:hypothetical protein [Bacteroidota bacterium]